jgi:glycosidase
MQWLQKEYAFDGIRIDTVPYVNKQFWQQLKTKALPSTPSPSHSLPSIHIWQQLKIKALSSTPPLPFPP